MCSPNAWRRRRHSRWWRCRSVLASLSRLSRVSLASLSRRSCRHQKHDAHEASGDGACAGGERRGERCVHQTRGGGGVIPVGGVVGRCSRDANGRVSRGRLACEAPVGVSGRQTRETSGDGARGRERRGERCVHQTLASCGRVIIPAVACLLVLARRACNGVSVSCEATVGVSHRQTRAGRTT